MIKYNSKNQRRQQFENGWSTNFYNERNPKKEWNLDTHMWSTPIHTIGLVGCKVNKFSGI
jgi:hypothetical protein